LWLGEDSVLEVRHTIAHILPFPAIGGTEHATLRIVQAVDSSRFAHVAFCLREAPAVLAHFNDAGIPAVLYDPPEPSYRNFREFWTRSRVLARAFAEQNVGLVHCADLLGASCAAFAGRLAGLPVITHIRNRFASLASADRRFLWAVRRFLFVSHHTWQHFGYRVSPRRGRVIFDGLDLPYLADEHALRESVRREFDIPASVPVVGMMARVAPQKDFTTLARAAARVRRVHPDVRFLIVGDYTSAETYRRHFCEVRRVLQACDVGDAFIFTGYRDDVPRLMAALDVFALCTHWEGLPLVILEAMAHGKAVVATSVDGIPEIVRDRATGLLHAHEDHEALAAHVVELLDQPRYARTLGVAGREVVARQFSREQFAARMNNVYASAFGI